MEAVPGSTKEREEQNKMHGNILQKQYLQKQM